MASRWHTQDPANFGGTPLDGSSKRVKELRQRFYLGRRMDSPMGGFLEPLGVRGEPDGSGTALFECSASSLRFTLRLPKATRTEVGKVKKQREAGDDPTCPRHDDPPRRLQRLGEWLMCPACGVRFGRAS